MSVFTILVTGSRRWLDHVAVRERLARAVSEAPVGRESIAVLHGDALKGADRMAEDSAIMVGVHSARVPARWSAFRPPEFPKDSAGQIRNRVLVELADAMARVHGREMVLVLAFRAVGPSPGTDGCVRLARERGLRVEVTHGNGIVLVTEAREVLA